MIQGVFIRRISRRLAEVAVNGQIYEAYISNGVDMKFLESGTNCYLRKTASEKRRTLFDLYSVYDGDTLVCVDAKEPMRIAEIWAKSHVVCESGNEFFFYPNTKEMSLIAMGRDNHDLLIQVMGTSFVVDREAYLPSMPSKALNERLESLLWMKYRGQDPRLLFVVCRNDADWFAANRDADPLFADLLEDVKEADVPIEAIRCSVNEEGMMMNGLIPVR